MKKYGRVIGLIGVICAILMVILGCELGSPAPQWVKFKKIAGTEQRLSHISSMVIDDKFAYVIMGGTIADQKEGNSGLRKIDLESGAVTSLDNGENIPQSENGGMAVDEKYIYWNASGKIWRLLKEGGKAEAVVSEKVGIGIDMVMDHEKIYWANHGYYSPGSPPSPSPVYFVPKSGGKAEIFAGEQNIPHSLVIDEKFVYWDTPTSILKKAKSGGEVQVVYQASDKEGVDELSADAENLYFGFRPAGDSRWDLRKVSKNGGEPTTIVKKYSLSPVTVDDTNIYFFNEESMYLNALCKVSKNGGEFTKLDTGYSGGVIENTKTQVYFIGMNDIYSFPK
jgi:hypothetical protein